MFMDDEDLQGVPSDDTEETPKEGSTDDSEEM